MYYNEYKKTFVGEKRNFANEEVVAIEEKGGKLGNRISLVKLIIRRDL